MKAHRWIPVWIAVVLLTGIIPGGRTDSLDVPESYETIQSALDAAEPGDTVSVAPGVYTGPGNYELRLLTPGVSVISRSGPDDTIIDCEYRGAALRVESGDLFSTDTVFSGFTIIRAYSDTGAMFLGASVTVARCIFRDNTSTGMGGALTVLAAAPRLTGCLFHSNVSESAAGAAVFVSSSPVIDRCTFTENQSGTTGSTLRFEDSRAVIANSILFETRAITSVRSRIHCSYSMVSLPAGPSVILTACIHVDPMFADPAARDFSLQQGSPCIDTADPLSRRDLDTSLPDMGSAGYGGDLPAGSRGGMIQGQLTVADSPVRIVEDLIVPADAELLIDENVELRFRNGARLTVYGSLTLHSNLNKPVFMHADQPLSWFGGVRFIRSRRVLVSGLTVEDSAGINGGGISAVDCSPNFWRTQVSHCWAAGAGGGWYLNRCSGLIIESTAAFNRTGHIDSSGGRGGGFAFFDTLASMYFCRATENTTIFYGGGIYCDWFSELTLAYSSVDRNTSINSDGGIAAPYIRIWNTEIRDNTAYSEIGGIWAYGGFITHCLIDGNRSFGIGGGLAMDAGIVANCLITGNHAVSSSGLFAYRGTSSTLSNCTFEGNRAGDGTVIVALENNTLKLIDSIIWNNQGRVVDSGALSASYSNIEFGKLEPWFGDGCLEEPPLFVRGDAGDHYLSQVSAGQQETSPCVSSGSVEAAAVCYPYGNGEICMAELHTSTSGTPDSDMVDMGFHYSGYLFADPTPLPSRTPTPSPTATVTPTPEPTGTPVTEFFGLLFESPGVPVTQGDPFYLDLSVVNRSDRSHTLDLYCVLVLGDAAYFYPAWSRSAEFSRLDLGAGETRLGLIPPFNWPDRAGTGSGTFFAVLVDPVTGLMITSIAQWDFYWE